MGQVQGKEHSSFQPSSSSSSSIPASNKVSNVPLSPSMNNNIQSETQICKTSSIKRKDSAKDIKIGDSLETSLQPSLLQPKTSLNSVHQPATSSQESVNHNKVAGCCINEQTNVSNARPPVNSKSKPQYEKSSGTTPPSKLPPRSVNQKHIQNTVAIGLPTLPSTNESKFQVEIPNNYSKIAASSEPGSAFIFNSQNAKPIFITPRSRSRMLALPSTKVASANDASSKMSIQSSPPPPKTPPKSTTSDSKTSNFPVSSRCNPPTSPQPPIPFVPLPNQPLLDASPQSTEELKGTHESRTPPPKSSALFSPISPDAIAKIAKLDKIPRYDSMPVDLRAEMKILNARTDPKFLRAAFLGNDAKDDGSVADKNAAAKHFAATETETQNQAKSYISKRISAALRFKSPTKKTEEVKVNEGRDQTRNEQSAGATEAVGGVSNRNCNGVELSSATHSNDSFYYQRPPLPQRCGRLSAVGVYFRRNQQRSPSCNTKPDLASQASASSFSNNQINKYPSGSKTTDGKEGSLIASLDRNLIDKIVDPEPTTIPHQSNIPNDVLPKDSSHSPSSPKNSEQGNQLQSFQPTEQRPAVVRQQQQPNQVRFVNGSHPPETQQRLIETTRPAQSRRVRTGQVEVRRPAKSSFTQRYRRYLQASEDIYICMLCEYEMIYGPIRKRVAFSKRGGEGGLPMGVKRVTDANGKPSKRRKRRQQDDNGVIRKEEVIDQKDEASKGREREEETPREDLHPPSTKTNAKKKKKKKKGKTQKTDNFPTAGQSGVGNHLPPVKDETHQGVSKEQSDRSCVQPESSINMPKSPKKIPPKSSTTGQASTVIAAHQLASTASSAALHSTRVKRKEPPVSGFVVMTVPGDKKDLKYEYDVNLNGIEKVWPIIKKNEKEKK
ncbi:hypothetical protein BKA69DRAFT_799877 [Paraphysoderma sedebokerense]|nr:hypothetical protein BKA69DRAFT_799877 [Paraphysoderma sedebokerense]